MKVEVEMSFSPSVRNVKNLRMSSRRLCTLKCYDPSLWDASIEGESPYARKRRKQQAVEICNQCFFRRECLEKAQEDQYLEGIWGGKNFAWMVRNPSENEFAKSVS